VRNRVRAISGVLLLCFLVWVTIWSCRSIDVSLEAEKTLHAYRLVLDLLEAYLHRHPGKWPESWEDLATIRINEPSAIYKWPNDIADVRNRVKIDFELTANDIASMSSQDFPAVKQLGPNYGIRPREIEDILRIARESQRCSRATSGFLEK